MNPRAGWRRVLIVYGILQLLFGVTAEAGDLVSLPGKPSFELLFQESDIVMLLIDPDSGRIADANHAAENFYGYAPDVLRSMTIQQINIFTPEQVAAERQLAKTQARNFFYFRHRRATGEIASVEVHSRPYMFGEHRLLFSIVHDITPGRHQEQDLWHYQQRLEETVDAQVRELERGRARLVGFMTAALLLQAALIVWLVRNIRQRHRLETEQELTTARLRESEERLVLVLHGGDLGLWDWHLPSGKVTYNERWATMLGYGSDEIAPHLDSWSDLVHPDDWPSIHAVLNPHLRGDTASYECEYRMRHKAGHWEWILSRGQVVERDAAGAAVRAAGTHLNISARKQVEQALRDSERLFRGLFEQAAVGVAQIDSNSGRFIRVNQAYSDIIGYTQEELEQLNCQTITHPDDLPRDLANMERLKGAEIDQFSVEKRCVTKAGETVWVNLTMSPMWAKGEPPGHHVAIVQDIGLRKQAEQSLRESERRCRQVFNQQFLFAATLDPSGRVLDINDLALNVQGMTREQCVGQWYWEIPSWRDLPDWQRTVQERVMRAARMETALLVEEAYRSADGSVRHAEAAYAAVRSLEGKVLYIVVQAFDITERKQTEVKVRAQIDELRAWQELMLNREDRVMELKREVNALLASQGKPLRYDGDPPPEVT